MNEVNTTDKLTLQKALDNVITENTEPSAETESEIFEVMTNVDLQTLIQLSPEYGSKEDPSERFKMMDGKVRKAMHEPITLLVSSKLSDRDRVDADVRYYLKQVISDVGDNATISRMPESFTKLQRWYARYNK